METLNTQFETGSVYQMTFIGDSSLKVEYLCVKRTNKTVTFEKYKGTETLTRRIKVYDDVEYVLQGSYSMAPSIKATRIVA